MRTTYWTTTAIVVGECAVGGTMDLFRMPPFYPMLIDLGYPSYLATILGTAKLIAAVIVIAPGLPRLKEWAYAGVLINMIGAAASNAAAHRYSGMIAPLAFAALALASWAIRPRSRRLSG
ncbi:DoxX family protein [Kribbella sp. NPDC004875]|uniref:DoxX family protein n=1 Tax=Kribbella sp. NPDC004875 TaxID=3364107 RepID=UPI0036C4BBC8